jgi:hypothetical protein
MLYVSIDIETSGLDPDLHSVLSIGAIIEDTKKKLPYEELPKFHAILLQKEICGSPRALKMNEKIIDLISQYLDGNDETRRNLQEHSGYIFCEPDEVAKHFYDFLFLNGFGCDLITGAQTIRIVNGKSLPVFGSNTKPIRINVAGKNFGTFDKLFLENLTWYKKLIKQSQKIADPAILFCDWENDESLPGLQQCKERGDIKGIVTHDALEDAWDVIQLLRTQY